MHHLHNIILVIAIFIVTNASLDLIKKHWSDVSHFIRCGLRRLPKKWKARKCKGKHSFIDVDSCGPIHHVSCTTCDVEYLQFDHRNDFLIYDKCSAQILENYKQRMGHVEMIGKIAHNLFNPEGFDDNGPD